VRHFAVPFCEVLLKEYYFYAENILQVHVLYFQDFKFSSLENNEASHTGNYMLFPFVLATTSRTVICLYFLEMLGSKHTCISRFLCSILLPAIHVKSQKMYFVIICNIGLNEKFPSNRQSSRKLFFL